MSQVGVSPMVIKYHANYLISTDDIHTCRWYHHIWYFTCHKTIYLFIHDTCNICHVYIYIYIYLHNTKRIMKYDPGKIEIHGYKIHV